VKRLVVLAGLATLAVGMAACGGSPTTGQPTVAPSTSDSGGGQDTSAPPSTGGQGTLPANQPCSLVSAAQLSQLGVSTQPTQDMIGNAPSCEMQTEQDHIIVTVRTDGGLGSFTQAATGGAVHDTTVGSHQAKQSVGNTGSCVIAIGVSSSSRVEVTVTGDGTTDPCPTAQTVAKYVEPNLP
jgi:uncharacterized protein DUF3558